MTDLRRLTCSLALLATVASGQSLIQNLGGQRVGTTVFTFLKIDPSVYGAGLGGAAVAMPRDASGLFYNPAIIAQLPGKSVVATNINWPADIRYNIFFSTLPVSRHQYLAFTVGLLETDPMMETTELQPFGTGREFRYGDQVMALTYGVRLTERFSFGTSVKYIIETLADVSMEAVLFDFGTYYITGFNSLRISSSFTNFGAQVAPSGSYLKTILDDQTGEELEIEAQFKEFSPPTTFRLGAAYDLIESAGQRLSVAVQLTNLADNAENYALGLSYELANTLSLRGGYQLNADEFALSMGAGVTIRLGGTIRLQFDYAYTQAQYLTSPQRLSVGLQF